MAAQRKRGRAGEERTLAELEAELDGIEAWFAEHKARAEASARKAAREDRIGGAIPEDWHRVEAEIPVSPARRRVTILLDEDVVRFFRAMGRGHQARMNAVLRAFVLGRKAGRIRGEFD